MVRGVIRLTLWLVVLGLLVLIVSWVALDPGYAVTSEVRIAAPPEKVWPELTDVNQWCRWMRGLDRCATVSGTGREVGSVVRANVYTGFEGLDITIELIEVTPLTRLRYRIGGGPQDGMISNFEMRAGPDGRSTRVHWSESQTLTGVWGPLMAVALRSLVTTHHDESLNTLKFRLERAI